jgi:hypothetical protein
MSPLHRLRAALGLLLPLLVIPSLWSQTAVESGNRTQTLHIGNMSEPNDLDPEVAPN